ncbi:MAG: methyl-accepting chemotaxis protein [Oscillospiraceae bacterium]|nr:methyl-accepting chemotaxis protein [Oscillospiraceae bacterium]
MKNMRVAKKLLVSFIIVIILTAMVGGVGIFGMAQINTAGGHIYYEQLVPITWLATSIDDIQMIRILSRDYVTAVLRDNQAKIGTLQVEISQLIGDITYHFDKFEAKLSTDRGVALFAETRSLLTGEYGPYLGRVYTLARAGDVDGIMAETDLIGPTMATIIGNLNEIMQVREGLASDSNESNDVMFITLLIVIIVVLLASIIIAISLALYLSGMIATPLVVLTKFMKSAATTGNITPSPEDVKVIQAFAEIKDELGQCIGATAAFVGEVNHEMDMLEKVGDGDLTITPNILSEQDRVGKALTKVIDNLNSMFSEINLASGQVSSGSQQIANGAQTLAQGSTEQAATVEELSASASEIADKTKANAQMAAKAADLATTIKNNAEKGSRQMDDMVAAVEEISQASQSISKVIKVIDDIAFQTNILALNAAVEAARAGQHGKGFAVVADEVRTLAAKSAEAAKDTGVLISNSMEKSEYGARIAKDTAESLVDIVSGINESTDIISEIALASESQTIGISQINSGIEQVATVVQQNSATAEESAAAAEELSSQSTMLSQLIARFRLKDGSTSRTPAAGASSAYIGSPTSFAASKY